MQEEGWSGKMLPELLQAESPPLWAGLLEYAQAFGKRECRHSYLPIRLDVLDPMTTLNS